MIAWFLFTRFGEVQIVLPVALLAGLLWARRRESRQVAIGWWLGIGLAASLTVLTKVAFLGWGIGSARLDFTGISGHAMFSSAIYPVVGAICMQGTPRGPRLGAALGALLALAIGVSRLVVQAHSGSEVLAGLLVGGSVAACALAKASWHDGVQLRGLQGLRLAMPALLVLCWLPGFLRVAPWLMAHASAPVPAWHARVSPSAPHGPPRLSASHALVTRLALELTDRDRPYARADLRLRHRPWRVAVPCACTAAS